MLRVPVVSTSGWGWQERGLASGRSLTALSRLASIPVGALAAQICRVCAGREPRRGPLPLSHAALLHYRCQGRSSDATEVDPRSFGSLSLHGESSIVGMIACGMKKRALLCAYVVGGSRLRLCSQVSAFSPAAFRWWVVGHTFSLTAAHPPPSTIVIVSPAYMH